MGSILYRVISLSGKQIVFQYQQKTGKTVFTFLKFFVSLPSILGPILTRFRFNAIKITYNRWNPLRRCLH
jgi:hypothetical protein